MTDTNQKYKVVLVGETQTGKTALIQRIVNDRFEENSETTMVASTLTTEVALEDGRMIKYEIWDTAGQEKYRSINKIFYKDAAIVIMVYDITNKHTYEEIKNYWYNQITTMCNKHPLIAIAGNKSDLYAKEEVKEKEGKEFAKQIGALFMLTSCLTNSNVTDLFEHLGGIYLGVYSIKELNGDTDEDDHVKEPPKVIENQPTGIHLNNKQPTKEENKEKSKC